MTERTTVGELLADGASPGEILRLLRLDTDLTQPDAGQRLQRANRVLDHLDQGTRRVTESDLHAVFDLYGVRPNDQRLILAALAGLDKINYTGGVPWPRETVQQLNISIGLAAKPLYERGMSLDTLAARFDRSRNSMKRYLREVGVTIRPDAIQQRSQHFVLPNRHRLRQARTKAGLNHGQTAQIYGAVASSYWRVEAGERRIRRDHLDLVLTEFGVPEEERSAYVIDNSLELSARWKEFGDALRRLRIARTLDIKNAARVVGVGEYELGAAERGISAMALCDVTELLNNYNATDRERVMIYELLGQAEETRDSWRQEESHPFS